MDVIECDVHEYRGRLEVRHLKTAGPLPFLWDRWELASASAPRLGLRELLEADRHGTTFMLDLKGRRSTTAPSVARHAARRGHHQPGAGVRSLVALGGDRRASSRSCEPVLSARNRGRAGPAAPAPGRRPLRGPRRLGPPDRCSTNSVVAELHRHVEVVMTWPVNDLAALDAALGLGVTGIISDEPDVLAALLARGG